ncbi:MAG: MarR family winged helix-turn-helix transcriptional regulator [Halioglobus sp.]|nr:MarR family winged helix-turn-helix transcriptional regulator [Halioglobus sp.]
MNAANPRRAESGTVWNRYRDNFSRHLIGVSRALQTHMMQTLQEACGHRDLRLGFAPYITLIGSDGRRLSELAQTLGISRQACNQGVKPIVAAGYVARAADPDDGRARRLTLTARGERLRRDGIRIVREMDEGFARLTGPEAFEDASRTLGRLYTELDLGPRLPGNKQPGNKKPGTATKCTPNPSSAIAAWAACCRVSPTTPCSD